MIICNSGQLSSKSWQGMSRIDKFIKFSNNIPLVHLRGRNLNQIIIDGWKPRRFHVKDHIGCFWQVHLHFVVNNWNSVLYNIGFHSIDQLNSRFLSRLIAMWEGLDISMIRDGNRLMSPLSSCRNNLFDLWQSIHSRHVSMSMKLNSTLTFWHQILPLIVNNFLHILHIHSQIACEVIHLHIPTDSEPRIFLN